MKTITYTCDCCNLITVDKQHGVRFEVNDRYLGAMISSMQIGELCSDCYHKLMNELHVKMKELEKKYQANLIEPEISNHG